jgi:hypothetical protein
MFELPFHIVRKKDEQITKAEMHQFWIDVFSGVPQPDDEEVVTVAWRLTRRLAALKGIVQYGELLREATSMHPSPWEQPVTMFENTTKSKDRALQTIQRNALPLLPPEDRKERVIWIDTMRILGLLLGVYRNVRSRFAFEALIQVPEEFWPNKETILELEETLVQETLGDLVRNGFQRSTEALQQRLYLTLSEAGELVNMAQALALPATLAPTEVFRAIQLLRLEDLVKRCRLDGDFRAELMALKVLNKLLGLNKKAAIQMDDDFMDKMENIIETKAITMEEDDEQNE